MVRKRINGEKTVSYVASEKRYRAQYPAGGKRRTISGKTRREVELNLRDALAKRDTNTLEKSRKDVHCSLPATRGFSSRRQFHRVACQLIQIQLSFRNLD